MNYRYVSLSIVVALAIGSACGPEDHGDDDGNDDASSSAGTTEHPTTDGTTTAGTADPSTTVADGATDTSTPVDCSMLTVDECELAEECQTVRGTEALPGEAPGEYECSDLADHFACAPIDCEPFVGVICSLDEPGRAMWLPTEDCIPAGWEACPNGMCV